MAEGGHSLNYRAMSNLLGYRVTRPSILSIQVDMLSLRAPVEISVIVPHQYMRTLMLEIFQALLSESR